MWNRNFWACDIIYVWGCLGISNVAYIFIFSSKVIFVFSQTTSTSCMYMAQNSPKHWYLTRPFYPRENFIDMIYRVDKKMCVVAAQSICHTYEIWSEWNKERQSKEGQKLTTEQQEESLRTSWATCKQKFLGVWYRFMTWGCLKKLWTFM